jgi:hypothetical protein
MARRFLRLWEGRNAPDLLQKMERPHLRIAHFSF